jgi:hypothetical protein
LQNCRIAELQNCRIAELQNCRIAELQNCRIAELQDCRIAELQNCRIAELQNCTFLFSMELSVSNTKLLHTNQSEALAHYQSLIGVLADRVRSVAKGFQTGAYISGRPGSGKTHTVRRVLDECKADYTIHNGRVSAAALFNEIEDRPDSLLVIDDVPLLFANLQASQILMAAVGGDPGIPRRVTYNIKPIRRAVEFQGGIIAISNVPLRHDPAGKALASRLVTLEHEPTDEMLIAFMESEARKGLKDIPPKECLMVFEHVVHVCRAGDFRIDLRNYFKGIEDYRCWKSEDCETDWRILIKSSMRRVSADELPSEAMTRAEMKAAEYEIVKELHAMRLEPDILAAEWLKQTQKKMDSYYRRKRELRLK